MCEQTPLPPQTLTDTPLFLIKITTNTIINFCLLVTQFVWKKDGAKYSSQFSALLKIIWQKMDVWANPSPSTDPHRYASVFD